MSLFLRSRVALALTVALALLAVSGCAGGWGDLKPTIATQTAGHSQTVTAGQVATFPVTVSGTGPFTYQWYLNGQAIAGANGSSYTTPPTTGSENGSIFTVAVTNAGGTVMSGPYTLTVNTPPAITIQPASETVTAGQTGTFSVTATGTAPLTYQWYENGTAIAGSIASSFTFPVTAVGNSGSELTVTVSNLVGSVTSSVAELTVNPIVPILAFGPVSAETYGNPAFPVSATSLSGGAVTYSVVSGPATISGDVVALHGIGPVVLGAVQAASGNYAPATATTTFTIAPEVPTLTFATIAPLVFGGAPFPVSASSVSSGTITYSVLSGPATIVGTTVTLTGAGPVVLQATQAASGDYAAATETVNLTAAAEVTTLTFSPVVSQVYGNSPFTVSATSASSGAITYSVVSGPATISGNMVTLTGGGTVLLEASQAATANYTSATTTASFMVTVNSQITAVSPANVTIAPGTQTFAATATGGPTDNVIWTASGGTISSSGVWTSPNTAGTYTITATSADETSVSSSTTVIISKPVITSQPVSQSICGSASLSLSVAGNYASSYQWYFNAAAIQGATAASYSTSSASSGSYTVGVTNAAGTTSSSAATVQVGSTITTQPASLTITQYQTAPFNVAASGNTPFTYQWYTVPSGGSATSITGATSSQYITPVQTSTTTASIGYYANVTDACGTVLESNTAELTVDSGNSPPTIVTQPLGQTTTAGGTPTFSVTAVGSGTLTYQWFTIPNAGVNNEITGGTPVTGTAILGATSSTYQLPASATMDANDQDVYYVEVSNAYGQAVSQHATLAVDAGVQIQILDEPVNAYANPGAAAGFTVVATSTLPLSYQWYEVPAGQSAASQTIVQSEGSGSTTTDSTTLPASAVAIPGATSATYTIPAVSSAMTGTVYYVVVTNNQTAAVTSNAAALFVGPPSAIPSCSSNWNILGTTTAFNSTNCSYQLTAATGSQYGEIIWPTLISTSDIQLSFTITTSDPSSTPADGFAMTLGDPSLGATLTSAGETGEGLGSRGIPGFVLAFDDFYNSACTGSGCSPGPYPADPSTTSNPDYLGVGRGEDALWENPYFNTNTSLPGGAHALAEYGATISHNYVVSIVNGYMNVTMDAIQVFAGAVSVPPVAYLYVTSSTGADWEQTVISNISAVVSAPSN